VIGTPVVGGFRSGNVPFLLDKGETGVLCDIESPKDIAKGMLEILSNSALAQSLIENAKRFARENYCADAAVQAYIDYYQAILGEKSVHARKS